MFNIAEYRKRARKLSDLLPWAGIVSPGVVINKDGSFQATLKLTGPDTETATDAQMVSVRAQLNNCLKRLGDGWCLHVESRRSRITPPAPGVFKADAAQMIENERCDRLRSEAAYQSLIFMTLTYLPPQDKTSQLGSFYVTKNSDETGGSATQYSEYRDVFIRQVGNIADLLRAVFADVKPLDDAQTLAFLHDAVSERSLCPQVPETPFYIDSYITDTPISSGLELRLGGRQMRVLSIRAYPDSTVPELLRRLDELGSEFRWTTRYIPLGKSDARALLSKFRREWNAKRKSASTLLREAITKTESTLEDPETYQKVSDAENALGELAGDDVAYGYFTLTIVTWGDAASEADERFDEVRRVVDGRGFVSEVETLNSLQAFLGGLPGHAYADVRRAPISTLNLCDLIPLSSVWAGAPENKHLEAPPLIETFTSSTTPFHLSLHSGDVGHTLIVGPTGNGKSTLLNLLAAQWLRYENAQVFSFDIGGSGKVLTRAVAGEFYELGSDTNATAFQPLRDTDCQEERVWAQDWVSDLAIHSRIELSAEARDELWASLNVLATCPRHERTLTTLWALCQDQSLRQTIYPYTVDGPYGELLDAEEDSLEDKHWQVFELERLHDRPSELGPVLSYIFHRLEKQFSPWKPSLLLLDEAWMFLGDTQFSRQIRQWLKTLRKKNVAVVFSTQSLTDISESPIAASVVESCPTRILLPNSSAMEQLAYERYVDLGLNRKQIESISAATKKQDYFFHSAEGSRWFQLGLGSIALALCGTEWMSDETVCGSLLAEDPGEPFLRAYLKHLGLAT